MSPHPRTDFSFRVEINGLASASFSEVSGLEVEIDVIEYRAGDEPNHRRKLPGLAKYANIVLKRGIGQTRELWDWMRAGLEGSVDRRDGSIVLMGPDRQDVMRWNFRSGWPCKWTGPELDASSGGVAIETLEIAHEGLELSD